MAVSAPRIDQAGEQRSARVESLRALAALAVLVGHTFALAVTFKDLFGPLKNRVLVGGGMGVFVFFTLSGYLLFLPFLRAQVGVGRDVRLATYARNRALRILPLYVVVVATLLVLQPIDADRGQWWRFALFIENFSRHTITRVDSPIWSLVVEMHYYIALPLIAWLVARLAGRSLLRTALILAVLAGASLALREAVAIHGHNNLGPVGGRYAMPTLFYLFASGMLLAVTRLALERRVPRWTTARVTGSSTAWIAAGVAIYLAITLRYSIQEPLVALAGFLVVGGAVLPLRSGALVRVLEWRPLALVGVASYSLYLWHVPILERLSGVHSVVVGGQVRIVGDPTDFKTLLVLGAPVCIAAALASYAIVERPFLLQRRRWATTD